MELNDLPSQTNGMENDDSSANGTLHEEDLVMCSKCKSKVHRDKIVQAFSKCSQVKDFVRRYENVQQLAGLLLIKQQQQNGILTEDETSTLSKARKILDNEMAKRRYAQVLEKRKLNQLKKKNQKKVVKTLEEKAQLDEELIVPPLITDDGDDGEIDMGK